MIAPRYSASLAFRHDAFEAERACMLKYGGAIVSPPIDPFIGQHPRPSISKQPAEIDLAVYSWRSARVLARSRSGQARGRGFDSLHPLHFFSDGTIRSSAMSSAIMGRSVGLLFLAQQEAFGLSPQPESFCRRALLIDRDRLQQ